MNIPIPFLKEPIGSGEIVKAATSAAGITPCPPCKARAARMNQALQFVPTREQWGTPPDAPEGWTLDESFTRDDGSQVLLFHHVKGRSMVWDVANGKYKRAHTFCCGIPDRARQEFERRQLK